jgi:DNA-binding LacI/PurR family transcriptional regulator
MNVRMEDVARAAGVCRATVSLALRDNPQIPEATRRRVHQAARKLGYAPNPLVSALMATRRRRRTRFQATLAFFTGHATRDGWRRTSAAYAALYTGAKVRARELGYGIEDFWLHEPDVSPARLRTILRARGLHGILLAPLPIDNASLPPFAWEDFSVLAVGYSVRQPEFHRISHDYFHGMTLALTRARAKGYRRIGLFLDRRVSTVLFNLWHAAFLAEQKTAPRAEPVEPLLAERWDDPAIVPWLREQQPDALVCLDPWRLAEMGRVPRHVALIALNADEASAPQPGISRDFAILGNAAVDRLVSLLQHNERGAPERPQTILIEGLWINDTLLRSRDPRERRS